MDYARSFKSRPSEPHSGSSCVQNMLIRLAALRILHGALFAFDLVFSSRNGAAETRQQEKPKLPRARFTEFMLCDLERFINHMVANA